MGHTVEGVNDDRVGGIIRLPKVLVRADAGAVEERVWRHLERRGISRGDSSTWPVGFLTKLQGLRESGVLNAFAAPAVTALVDEVLGAGTYRETEAWGPALITFPESGPWRLPARGWHLDLPGAGDAAQPGALRLFGFISDVEPGGGGTLVVEGSHHLVKQMLQRDPVSAALPSKAILKRLTREHGWFQELQSTGARRQDIPLWEGTDIDGIRVRVRELTGVAGDVVAMLPWTIHAISPNTSDRPRMMVTHTVYRHDQPYYAQMPGSASRGPAPVA